MGTLGASHYIYAEATWTQQLPDWIGAHVRMYQEFGGVPALTVPDNLKTGVQHACYYEPDLNPTYQDLATHYGTAVLPTRVARPDCPHQGRCRRPFGSTNRSDAGASKKTNS